MNIAARWATLTSGIALGYFLLGKLGLALALPPGFVSAIWPAAGFAFAAALVWGWRATWPGILLGSMATNATVGGGFHLDTAAFCIATGSALQAVVGGVALKRLMPNLELNDPQKVFRFSLLGIGSCLIAATIGNLTLLGHGFISLSQLPQSFLTWWLGDAFGVQIFAPLALVVLAPSPVWKQRRVTVGLPLLVAFALSGVLYSFVRASDERQLQRDFASMVAPFEHEVRSLEQNSGRALRQLAASYSLRGEVPGAEFEQMVADIRTALPSLKTIAWLPVLDAAGQAAYAQKVRPTGAPKALHWPPDFSASADGLAAPVAMIYPLEGSEILLGVDMLGEAKRAQAVRAALATGQLTATTPIKLKSDPDGPGALLLMVPVKNALEQGVISGAISLRTIDQALLATPGVVWELREVLDHGGQEIRWRSSSVTMPAFTGHTYLDRLGVYSQQRVALGGKEWHMLLHMPHAKLLADAGNSPTLVLMMALFVCGLVANFALIRTGERERIEAEVLEKTAALNAEIAERKTYQAALEQSKRVAESANLAKSQFLATMSHEIRTPMNGILGMAQLLMMDDVGEAKRKEFVRTILGSGKALLAILNDILDLSKIEAGKMELHPGPFDAAAVVEEVASLFREAAQAKGIALRVHVQLQPLQRYTGDSIRLRQMLANYVGNAIKFSEGGEIVLTLRERDDAAPDAEGTAVLEFAVSDQGMGIPQAKVAELFQPFVQVDASATRRYGGSGLGLSIVRKLAQQMQGDVGVESQIGVGSRFWFTVRCPRVAADAEAQRTSRWQSLTGSDTGADTAPSGWVLVVDDNAINRMVAENMLTRLGLEARCVENGQEALDLLAAQAANPPLLVLMDCQMPVMDGYAATRAIRAREASTAAPRQTIVALTAAAFDADRALCLDAGMDAFVVKPIAFDELARIIQDVLEQKQ
ncbi:MAG: ATP-binding protein [Pseudomonadota bacterium]